MLARGTAAGAISSCNDNIIRQRHRQPRRPHEGQRHQRLEQRQQHHETGHAQPLVLAGTDELVNHDLGAIGEIAELGFPERENVRLRLTEDSKPSTEASDSGLSITS